MKPILWFSCLILSYQMTTIYCSNNNQQSTVNEPSLEAKNDIYSDETLTETQKWELIMDFYNEYAWPHRWSIINYTRSALKESKIQLTSECRKALNLYANGLEDEASWAYESE